MQFLKNIFLIIIFILLSNISVLANDKLAFIDINYLIENSNMGKKISKSLNKINNDNKKKINLKKEMLINQENEIKKVQNILSQEELKIKVSTLREKIKVFNDEKKSISKDFNDTEKVKLSDFFEKINPLISDYMNKESISILVEKKNVFIGKSSHDITNEILEIINSKF